MMENRGFGGTTIGGGSGGGTFLLPLSHLPSHTI